MQLSLERAGAFMTMESPKEYMQQLSAVAEARRRAKLTRHRTGEGGGGGLTNRDLLEGLRRQLAGDEE